MGLDCRGNYPVGLDPMGNQQEFPVRFELGERELTPAQKRRTAN